jgi:predicted GIY-YIG superfamily endonuclease
MNVNKLIPKCIAKNEFTYKGLKNIPSKQGCYCITNINEDILYIGLATNLAQRSLQHIENPDKHLMTKYGCPYYFCYCLLDKNADIFKTERGWLNLYELEHGELPPYNKIHSPVS